MKKQYAIPILLVAALAACQNQRMNYKLAAEQYTLGVNFLSDEMEAGRLDKETAKKYQPAVNGGRAALENWKDLLKATPDGEKPDIPMFIIDSVLDAVAILEAYVVKKEVK